MKPLFSTGLKRSLVDDDIFEVPNGMRSDLNTENFAKVWDEEMKKPNPSMLRVIFKLHGLKVVIIGFLFSVAETIARYGILRKLLLLLLLFVKWKMPSSD